MKLCRRGGQTGWRCTAQERAERSGRRPEREGAPFTRRRLIASPPVDRLLLSIAAAPVVFAACAFATRAPARRITAALAGGAAFAAGNVAWDVVAHAAGWWSYRGVGGGGRAPLLWYAAAVLSAAGVSLIGWRAWRRFGPRGRVASRNP